MTAQAARRGADGADQPVERGGLSALAREEARLLSARTASTRRSSTFRTAAPRWRRARPATGRAAGSVRRPAITGWAKFGLTPVGTMMKEDRNIKLIMRKDALKGSTPADGADHQADRLGAQQHLEPGAVRLRQALQCRPGQDEGRAARSAGDAPVAALGRGRLGHDGFVARHRPRQRQGELRGRLRRCDRRRRR